MRFNNLVNFQQLAQHLDQPDWLVFDCRFDLADVNRGQSLYRQSHVAGAFYAHLDHQLSSPITAHSGRHPLPDVDALVAWLASCGLSADKQVVVYDDSFGAMAARLWWLLKCLGHESVALLDGGWQAWQASGFALDADEPKPEPTRYQADFDWQYVVSTQQVMDNLDSKDFALVDVRTEERFRGISEPIDPVAGHIPGALNIPLSRNLDASGQFLPPDQLRELYAAVNASCPPQQQVYMCGSGVTACHSLLAMHVAGYAMPRVYAGSWSEWIRDPARLVATNVDVSI